MGGSEGKEGLRGGTEGEGADERTEGQGWGKG